MSSYRLPRRHLLSFLQSVLLLRPRSFARDAAAAWAAAVPTPQVSGGEHVPPRGPCLVLCNHYTRPGFASWWLTLIVSAAVADRRAPDAEREIHWVIAAAWTYPPGSRRERWVTPLTAWAFERVARVYGFVTMPPMPPRPHEVEARAAAVLRVVRLARRLAYGGGMVGLAPEGRDVPGGLGDPPDGAGQFVALLATAGLPLLPVGVGERDGRLCLSFGPPFVPQVPQRRSERDRAVARQVMDAIARQVPGVENPLTVPMVRDIV